MLRNVCKCKCFLSLGYRFPVVISNKDNFYNFYLWTLFAFCTIPLKKIVGGGGVTTPLFFFFFFHLTFFCSFWYLNISRDRNRNTGIISCRVCLEDFQTSINCKLFCILSSPQNLKLKLKKVLLCTNICKCIYYFYWLFHVKYKALNLFKIWASYH